MVPAAPIVIWCDLKAVPAWFTVPFRTVVSPCALDAATSVEHSTSATSVTPVRKPLVIQREGFDPVVVLVRDVQGAVPDLEVGRVVELPVRGAGGPAAGAERLQLGAAGREVDQAVRGRVRHPDVAAGGNGDPLRVVQPAEAGDHVSGRDVELHHRVAVAVGHVHHSAGHGHVAGVVQGRVGPLHRQAGVVDAFDAIVEGIGYDHIGAHRRDPERPVQGAGVAADVAEHLAGGGAVGVELGEPVVLGVGDPDRVGGGVQRHVPGPVEAGQIGLLPAARAPRLPEHAGGRGEPLHALVDGVGHVHLSADGQPGGLVEAAHRRMVVAPPLYDAAAVPEAGDVVAPQVGAVDLGTSTAAHRNPPQLRELAALAPLGHVPALPRELLDTLVVRVGHVHVVGRVNGDAVRPGELSVGGALGAPVAQPLAAGTELGHAVVREVRDVDVAV